MWDWASGVPELLRQGRTRYLVGHDTLGWHDGKGHALSEVEGWTYSLPDALGSVRQATDEQGDLASAWLFDPDGALLESPDGPVSHLVCGGVYDQSTGLLYKCGRYFVLRFALDAAQIPVWVSGCRCSWCDGSRSGAVIRGFQ